MLLHIKQQILKLYLVVRNPPIIGPINPPISIVILFKVEEISFKVISSLFGLIFFIIFVSKTKP
jgi:hypothetical protein